MAVYKPSNCVPFLSCLDLTKNQYISCEINTSNEIVTGYRLKILDNDNNVIFEGANFSSIPKNVQIITDTQNYVVENTGLNGSTLTLPLIVVDDAFTQDNLIYYNKGEWYAQNGEKILNFSNDNINQPYKWQIVLAQGELGESIDSKYYDMIIDEAKMLGSTNNRIQSYLSKNIYKDYYIQLYEADVEDETKIGNQIGVRTRISSYDYSYGFIYPQENTISQDSVDKASYFKIFKDTSDPQYVSTARLVNYRLQKSIDKIELNGKFPASGGEFAPSKSVDITSNPYFTQVYEGDVTNFITYSSYGVTGEDSLLAQGTTFLLMYQGDNNPIPAPTYNSYNGVFSFQSATYNSSNDKTTIKWLRPANFNTYANFLNRLICVRSESKNYSTSVTSENLGTINQTELAFYEETAVGLYPVYKNGTKDPVVKKVENVPINRIQIFQDGIISSITIDEQPTGVTLTAVWLGGNRYIIKANRDDYSGNTTVNITYIEDYGPIFKNSYRKAYISPFVGIHAGDELFYGDKLKERITIKSIDDEANYDNKFSPTWSILYESDVIFPVGTKYSIRSFFKTSDENPFYAKPTPILTINSEQWMKERGQYKKNEYGYCECIKRYITVNGTIVNRNWVNYQWILTDFTAGYIQKSDKIYRGSTEYTFYGLQNKHYYELQWVVEDEYGAAFDFSQMFFVNISIEDNPFPFNVEYECETQSVVIDFARDGIVIPNPAIYSLEKYMVKTNDGASVVIKGTYNSEEELKAAHPTGKAGEGYLVNGELYVWSDYVVDGTNKKATYIVKKIDTQKLNSLPYEISYKDSITDGYMELGDIEETATVGDIEYLMEYTETQIGDTSAERGLISAPTTSDFALNSQHILNSNFIGDIITYEIDTDDFNGLPSYISIAISLLSPFKTDKNGEIVAEYDRNKIRLRCFKKIDNGLPINEYNVFFNIFKKEGNDWKLVSDDKWQPDQQIVSSWVNSSAAINENYDYIFTTRPYIYENGKQRIGEEYLNINGDKLPNSSDGVVGNQFDITDSTTTKTEQNVWYDRKTELVQQASGEDSKINVFKAGEDGYWNWPNSSRDWEDKNENGTATIYNQVLLTGHTGRQNINKYKITFNIVIKDYNKFSATSEAVWHENITANAFIEEIEVK